MKTEKEVREFLETYASPEDCENISSAYAWGVIDALRWVLDEGGEPVDCNEVVVDERVRR